jgi:cbb3-type cytochrome oxidase subunit 3
MEGIARATIMVLLGFSLAAIYWLLQVSFKSTEEAESAS